MSPWPPEGSARYCMVCSVYSVIILDGALPHIAGCLQLLPFMPLLPVQCWSRNQFLQRLCSCFVRPLLMAFHLLLLVQRQTISGLPQERCYTVILGANNGVAKSNGGDVGGTWLQLMCCALQKT